MPTFDPVTSKLQRLPSGYSPLLWLLPAPRLTLAGSQSQPELLAGSQCCVLSFSLSCLSSSFFANTSQPSRLRPLLQEAFQSSRQGLIISSEAA